MVESFKKLKNICKFNKDDGIHWMSNLESTHWLEHLSQVIIIKIYVK